MGPNVDEHRHLGETEQAQSNQPSVAHADAVPGSEADAVTVLPGSVPGSPPEGGPDSSDSESGEAAYIGSAPAASPPLPGFGDERGRPVEPSTSDGVPASDPGPAPEMEAAPPADLPRPGLEGRPGGEAGSSASVPATGLPASLPGDVPEGETDRADSETDGTTGAQPAPAPDSAQSSPTGNRSGPSGLSASDGTAASSAVPAPGLPAGRVPGLPIPGLPDPDAPDDDPSEVAFEPIDLDAPVRAGPTETRRISAGSRCKGTIITVGESGVIVSFGAKVEGHVPLEEFRDASGEIVAAAGQEIEVFVERLGAPGEYAALSYRRAREAAAWKRVEAAHASHEPLQATVEQRIRGGLRVDIGVRAFLPGSQIDVRPVRNLDAWVGKTIDVLVVECNRRRSNAVVSRSELLKVEREAQLAATLERLNVGEPASGVVKNITTYGVFVDLGGIDGLIKMTELSYGRVGNPADLLESGQEVTAKVLRIDAERGRVALSLRAMRPDPWLTIGERYKAGDRVQGRVSSVTDYGAFVELESGVEGLIHISEIEWSRRPKHPSKTFDPGTETEAVVLEVKPADRRISLSFRRLVPDPWDNYAASLEPGLVVEGVVRRIVSYGLFVEITEGLEGLVHVSDLSWDARGRNPHDVARKDQKINTVILKVDVENRRLSLGVKQLEPDSWDTFLSQAAVGDTVAGLVRRLVKFGAFVELAPGVEGLCHSSQFPRGKDGLKPGSRYHFEILDVNERARRIGLRCDRADPIEDEPAPAPAL